MGVIFIIKRLTMNKFKNKIVLKKKFTKQSINFQNFWGKFSPKLFKIFNLFGSLILVLINHAEMTKFDIWEKLYAVKNSSAIHEIIFSTNHLIIIQKLRNTKIHHIL